jgi:hypothetical protein
MTKAVRIENADTSNHKVKVMVYDMVGAEPDPAKDRLVMTRDLDSPTQLASEYIHSTRYIVVAEGK